MLPDTAFSLRKGRVLAVECATEACSVALFQDGALIAGEFRQLGRGHAEALVPMIAALPDRGKADAIVTGLGPGSFTGVRIALAAARALALAWGVRAWGYPTLALIAAMARGDEAVDVLAATTGGHGEWFVQGFGADGGALAPLASLAPQDAAAQGIARVAGSQAQALVDLRGSGEARVLWPDARALMQLPDSALTGDLSPLYGRAPDARLPGGLLPTAA
ncbi:tRNA (adenosine(37)-N6)-threonylcarbamoyltransferase complex dimerization subunit type 1 TsaB [Novosphingobium rosa]|uniref:tRNA (adenosine(37)-N6)-threonylcarbamoyltransferase complex dimerization subunit type 1 TsaB n=1 Tax=Novosphingobium rosa TaxID=76978 RepID=UPI000A6A5914|nr:tRNA (adenosine(37)-N6)-threonylcarbamoyltransferase complex dimerization subunit type 1 TsaB [Novosphingobium rosa]